MQQKGSWQCEQGFRLYLILPIMESYIFFSYLILMYCAFLQVPAHETVEKSGISNHTEAILVQALVTLLLKVRTCH